jgi:Cellulase (glycosyl hydrolase family 5)
VRLSFRNALFAVAILCLGATATGWAAGKSPRTYTTSSTRPMRTALFDLVNLNRANARAFELTRGAGAQYVRLTVRWSSIAPNAPSDPADPTSAGYSWGTLDATVAAAEGAGLTPMLNIGATPNWAYAQRPDGVNAGRPKIAALAQFATALATHYDGSAVGARVANVFEVWNEPNLSLDLSPAKASVYRKMVNAVAASVHAVDSSSVVVAGGLDPFGHRKSTKQKWYSVRPLAFMRSLLCLSKGSHPHSTCNEQVHFDVWSHHPYTFGGPFGHALLPDDISLGDLPKMRALLQAGVRLHHIASSRQVQFWVTEFGWDSNPPRRHAAPMALAARWTAESLYSAWRSGVSLLTWFGLEDQRSPSPYQSGLYFHSRSLQNPRPKPVLTAFRFPFVAYLGKSTVRVWGRDATSDRERVAVQRRHGKNGAWQTVGYVVANSSGVFQANLKLHASKNDWLRGIAPGSGKSLPFSLRVPHHPHIGPWGSH